MAGHTVCREPDAPTPAPAAMEARQRRALVFTLVAVACDYIGVGMMRVTLPYYARALGGSGALIGGLETAYGIGQACARVTEGGGGGGGSTRARAHAPPTPRRPCPHTPRYTTAFLF